MKGSELRVRKLQGHSLGAEVTGIDLAHLSAAELAALKAAWVEHAVLVIRGQDRLRCTFMGASRVEYWQAGILVGWSTGKLEY